MKNVFLVAAVMLTVLSSCKTTSNMMGAQRVTVDADKKLNTDFSKYKTFAWASQVDSKMDPGLYFLNDLALKERIRDAVKFALEGRGYNMQRESPDLIVNFRVFDKPATIRGFTGYGTTYFGTNEVREPEDVKTFDVQAGSLIVNLIDAKTGQMVWRGLASGLTSNNGFNTSTNKINEAVKLVFDNYSYRADNLGNK